MTIYRATRNSNNDPIVTVHKSPEDKGRPLTHINIHSPGGFEWGYYGSGPSDLAIAILAHHFHENSQQVKGYWRRSIARYRGKGSKAIDLHQAFKNVTVGCSSI